MIGTRGLLSASFFCAEAYIVFVLQDRWGLTPGTAGLALTAVGLAWAGASQAQSRLGARVSDVAAMRWGTSLVLAGTAALAVVVAVDGPPALAMAAYVVAGAGMGFGYPRTSVAMLAASTDADRGFNSAALSIADSLGGALALSLSGVVFGAATRAGADPFVVGLRAGDRHRRAQRRRRRTHDEPRQVSSAGSVFSRISSSVTPGASSTSLRPAGVTSMTHRSVMIRCTTPRPV